MNRNSAAIRRFAGLSLVTGLCVAAAAAVAQDLRRSTRAASADLGSAADPAAGAAGFDARAAAGTADFLASALIQVADRIDALNSDPGNRAPEIQTEVNRLRSLAESVENRAKPSPGDVYLLATLPRPSGPETGVFLWHERLSSHLKA